MTGKVTKKAELQRRLKRHKILPLVASLHYLAIVGLALLTPLIFTQREDVIRTWWTLAALAAVVLALQVFSLARIRALSKAIERTETPWPRTRRARLDFDKVWREQAP